MNRPKFKPNVPEHLLHGKTESEIWMYNQLSLQSQQNEYLLERAEDAERHRIEADNHRAVIHKRIDDHAKEVTWKFSEVDKRLKPFEELKKNVAAKWALLVFLGPLAWMLIGPLIKDWIGKLFAHKP